MINRIDILRGFNLWAIFVCLFFAVFLPVFVDYSRYYSLFIVGAAFFAINHQFIIRQYHRIAFVVFAFTANGLMLAFDSGVMSPIRSFVFYIPLLLCNLMVSSWQKKWQPILSVLVTVLCICLTSFTDITPKISLRLYQPEHIAIVAYFNTFIAVLIVVVMSYYLSKSASDARRSLRENKRILSKNEQLLQSINQNIDIGICRTNVLSNKLLYVNNAKVKLFGYESAEEMLRVSPDAFYKDTNERNRVIALLEEQGHVSNIEVQYRRKDGSLFWGLLTSNKTKDEQGSEVYDGALRDITDLKQLREELILAKEAAEKSSLAKSQFLSTMSHEIRTPMNAVIGASNLLLQDEPRKEQMENLLLLKSAGNNLMRLINNILDFSKIELDKVEFEKVPVDLKQLLFEIIETHRIEAQKKQIVLEHELSALKDRYILDPIRFTQVMNNLLSNAVKFTDEGKVSVTAELVGETLEESTFLFTVKDTGIGIAAERHQKVFDSFSQEDIDITRRYGGSGLGLAITRRIIQRLGSTITLKSEKGEGAAFSFILTFQKSRETIVAPPFIQQFSSSSLSGMKILLVEDNRMNTVIITKFLARWGAVCTACENGPDAIRKAQEETFDLILMDLHMPGMDGFQTTKEIRLFNKEIPIFALTADAFAETRISALASGMNDFIPKPFDPQELFNKAAAVRLHNSLKVH